MLDETMKKLGITAEELIDSIRVGVYVTDEKGNTIALNDECCKTGGLSKAEVVGKNMKELMGMGYVEESDSFRVARSGKEESLIQHLGDGGQLYLTGVPIYKNGNMVLIVSTERDISETIELEKLLNESEEKNKRYRTRLEFMNRSAVDTTNLIAESTLMKQVLMKAGRVGRLDTTVLIQGESGTGKEMIADYIYKNGDRSDKAFLKVNCAAIPESLIESEFFGYEKGAFTGAEKEGKMGLFEAANGGTIFLDEIGDLSVSMQAKLLRVVQDKEIRKVGSNSVKKTDVKIIAASNIDLRKAAKDGKFREDLYYRLNVASIEMPPLRSHPEDIRPLVAYFTEVFNNKYGMNKHLKSEALAILEKYDWPGNIRELRNLIERVMINYEGDAITGFQIQRQISGNAPDELHISEGKTLKEMVEDYEKSVILKYCECCKNGRELAKALGVDAATVSRKFRKYGIRL